MNRNRHFQSHDPRQAARALGGALIDAEGREIPITEQMVQGALRAMAPRSMGERGGRAR